MKQLISIIAVLVSIMFIKTSHAQNIDQNPIHLSLDLQALYGDIEKTNFSMFTEKLNIIIEVPKINSYFYLTLGRNKSHIDYFQHFTLDQDNFVDLEAVLRTPKFESCIGSGGSITLPTKYHRIKIKFDASMIAPINKQLLEIDRLVLFPNGAQFPITSIAAGHVEYNYNWSKFIGKTSLILNHGPANFFITGGFTKLSASIKMNLDDVAQEFIGNLGVTPEEVSAPTNISYILPTLELGTSINIKNAVEISLSAGILPIYGEDGYKPFTILGGTITFLP